MRAELRTALEKLIFLISEHGLRWRFCTCRKPIDSLVTPAIREAMDKVEKLLAEEPGPGRFSYIETKDK